MSERAYLVLENGKVFAGAPCGARGDVVAEVVFTTGMTGYLETLTDKSYCGQIAVQSFPLIGNYGVIPEDFESDPERERVAMRGYVLRELCDAPSNFRSRGGLDAWLQKAGVVGLCGVDTRALVRVIREQGVMNGMLTDDLDKVDPAAIAAYRVRGAVEETSTKIPYRYPAQGEKKHRVALLDYGVKQNILRELARRGCEVCVLPCHATAQQVLAEKPDGILLSNGPGDPVDNQIAIRTLRALAKSGVPIFGVCLGHQLLALSQGFATTKLRYGHRGANQPVRDERTRRVYMTSQNHGYAVVGESVDENVAEQLFTNVNDGSCEGIAYRAFPALTVQFHPEACGGPQDTGFLFDRFIQRMEA